MYIYNDYNLPRCQSLKHYSDYTLVATNKTDSTDH